MLTIWFGYNLDQGYFCHFCHVKSKEDNDKAMAMVNTPFRSWTEKMVQTLSMPVAPSLSIISKGHAHFSNRVSFPVVNTPKQKVTQLGFQNSR